jgi:hypothetical protein
VTAIGKHIAWRIGATSGRALINVSRKSDYSSILDQSLAAEYLEPTAGVVRREEITVVRLEDLFAPFRGRAVFLKVDHAGL